jgi:hypothetical protein
MSNVSLVARESDIKIKSKYWIHLLFSLGVFGAPLIYRFWDHSNNLSVPLISGILVVSTYIWTLGNVNIQWIPVFVIHSVGWILVRISVANVVLRDTHLFLNPSSFGG